MNTKFRAIAVADEIDLNKIALRCGIPKKYTWEEPLTLQGELLENILSHPLIENQKVMIFAYGSIVYLNCDNEDFILVANYLKTLEKRIDATHLDRYVDYYELIVDESLEYMEITDELVYVPTYDIYYPDLIAIVIAKSVGLEKIEEKIRVILDNIEGKIDRFEAGKLRLNDRELAKLIARILRHEYNSIAYIMILDKPDITWTHLTAAEFYERMSEFFELSDRYEIFKNKTKILNDIVGGFSMISHSIKGLFLEYLVVILIVIEVILMTLDILK